MIKNDKYQIWGNHLEQTPDQITVAFCAGRDVTTLPMADEILIPFDIWCNRAHGIMLYEQGIMDRPALEGILSALKSLEDLMEKGAFSLDPALEDVHMNIESFVSAQAGPETGGRLHTGRSRNDQVSCDMRLFLRARLLVLGADLNALAETLLKQAEIHIQTVMPGFSHHQPAMITTWGHWLTAYAQGLIRDMERVKLALELVDRNPLGAAASFGTSWAISRERTTELLGFDRVDENTLDCISARWEHEAQAAHTMAMVMNHLSVMAQDLILLSHPYWGMITLSDAFVSGSSIMPQKKNPDFAEVIKGKASWAIGQATSLMNIPTGNMSGYNRDSQMTKYAIMDIWNECAAAPVVLKGVFEGLTVNTEAMKGKLNQGFLDAADFADALARGLKRPFRECYNIAATAVRYSEGAGHITQEAAARALEEAGCEPSLAVGVLANLADPLKTVSLRNHTGSPAPEQVHVQINHLKNIKSHLVDEFSARKEKVSTAYQRCLDYTLK